MDKADYKILVVDDHALTRDMVRMILKGLGFSDVTTAENGEVAFEAVKASYFDLIICDWNMPRFTGLELLTAVRTDKDFESTPFLMLTAEAYRDSVKAALDAGVTDYIAKPFTAGVLGEKVLKALSIQK